MEITAEKARVIDRAFVYKKPVAPKKLIILASCLLIGILLPFLWIYVKKLLQSTVITRADISQLTKLPIIAEIPKLKKKRKCTCKF
jgi:capsular polysaccharide biosynthesis protein